MTIRVAQVGMGVRGVQWTRVIREDPRTVNVAYICQHVDLAREQVKAWGEDVPCFSDLDRVDVYMDIGVDSLRSRADQAVCIPDIVRRSVLATYRAGGKGVVFSPAYAGMNLANLDGAAQALTELGLK